MEKKTISICCLIGGLLSAAINSAAYADEAVPVKSEPTYRSASFREDSCRAKADGNPTALMECDSKAIAAANASIARSPNNAHFDAFLSDMFEPLLFARTGGDDALAERVVISAIYVEFARRRAEILAGRETAPAQDTPAATSGRFEWMKDKNEAQILARHWQAIRDSDCAVYATPQCGTALDIALRDAVGAALK